MGALALSFASRFRSEPSRLGAILVAVTLWAAGLENALGLVQSGPLHLLLVILGCLGGGGRRLRRNLLPAGTESPPLFLQAGGATPGGKRGGKDTRLRFSLPQLLLVLGFSHAFVRVCISVLGFHHFDLRQSMVLQFLPIPFVQGLASFLLIGLGAAHYSSSWRELPSLLFPESSLLMRSILVYGPAIIMGFWALNRLLQ